MLLNQEIVPVECATRYQGRRGAPKERIKLRPLRNDYICHCFRFDCSACGCLPDTRTCLGEKSRTSCSFVRSQLQRGTRNLFANILPSIWSLHSDITLEHRRYSELCAGWEARSQRPTQLGDYSTHLMKLRAGICDQPARIDTCFILRLILPPAMVVKRARSNL